MTYGIGRIMLRVFWKCRETPQFQRLCQLCSSNEFCKTFSHHCFAWLELLILICKSLWNVSFSYLIIGPILSVVWLSWVDLICALLYQLAIYWSLWVQQFHFITDFCSKQKSALLIMQNTNLEGNCSEVKLASPFPIITSFIILLTVTIFFSGNFLLVNTFSKHHFAFWEISLRQTVSMFK